MSGLFDVIQVFSVTSSHSQKYALKHAINSIAPDKKKKSLPFSEAKPSVLWLITAL